VTEKDKELTSEERHALGKATVKLFDEAKWSFERAAKYLCRSTIHADETDEFLARNALGASVSYLTEALGNILKLDPTQERHIYIGIGDDENE